MMKKLAKSPVKLLFGSLGYEIKQKARQNRLDLTRLNGNDCLVAGPFLGEFGWELMQWQGFIRQLSQFYKKTIVYGRPQSDFFYQDFVSEYRTVECDSWDASRYVLHKYDYAAWADQFDNVDLLVADNRCLELPRIFTQTFIPFGERVEENVFDVVIHARNIPAFEGNSKKSTRNWSKDSWDRLCEYLPDLRIAAVGIPELSYAAKGTEDLRGINTEELCSVLASSRCCIGPSSGLMHLASLCRTPHLVWASKEATWGFGGTEYRYAKSWNPFATQVEVLTGMGWNPTPEYVQTALLKLLDSAHLKS
jgi:hypothetical protein